MTRARNHRLRQVHNLWLLLLGLLLWVLADSQLIKLALGRRTVSRRHLPRSCLARSCLYTVLH